MTVALDVIADISRSVAAEFSPAFTVVGVASTAGGSDQVEVLITIVGCHKEPCRLLIHLNRADRSALELELRAKLRDALFAHSAPSH